MDKEKQKHNPNNVY